MGEMADNLTEQELDNYWAHVAGDCGPDMCQYCEYEYELEQIANGEIPERAARSDKAPY